MTEKQRNYLRAKAIEEKNKKRILEICPNTKDRSGIYCFYRIGEDGLQYAYVGQSVSVLTRLSQHLSGYNSHIDKSIRKHGLYSETDNMYGYKIGIEIYCDEKDLDKWERYYIKEWAAQGYQLRNVTSGGQDSGKTDINERKPSRGYRDGVAYGRKAVIKEVRHLFDLHLKAVYKADKPSKNAIKALDKFNALIQGDENDE